MRITAKKQVRHTEIVTVCDSYSVRVQVQKGFILNLQVDLEDDCIEWIKGINKEEQKRWDKLTGKQREEIRNILEETDFG